MINNRLSYFIQSLKRSNLSIENSIVISGETRSGSTWLMEILQKLPGTVTQWEPLHPNKGTVRNLSKHYGDRPFLEEAQKDESLYKLLEATLEGKAFTMWTTRYNLPKHFIKPRFVLTKFVRANMLMPWLLKAFNFKRKPILIIRHPIAACLSQLRTFHKNNELDVWQVPDCVNNERYFIHADYINNLKTHLERLVALWCINNVSILNNAFVRRNTIFLFYEELLTNPNVQVERILEEWQLNTPDIKEIVLKDLMTKSKTATNDFEENISIQLSKWKEMLTEQERNRIQQIFDYFDFTLYNTTDVYPKAINQE